MIDLHVHTTHSDGTFTPDEVVRYAKEKELAAIAITDHDCVSGVKEAKETGNNLGIEVIAGIEFSANHEAQDFHIIGLIIDIKNTLLNEAIARQSKAAEKCAERIFERLIASGFNHISFDEFRRQGSPSSKGHFKQYMTSANLPCAPKELEKHIGKEGMAYAFFPLRSLTVADAISVIHDAGGLAIWAHPFTNKFHQFGREEVAQAAITFKAMGLDGVEAYWPGLWQDDFDYIIDLAEKHKFFISGGSDFHGNKAQSDLGNGKIPYSVLNAMLTAKANIRRHHEQ
ncbi:MAG: PHP domain-containing protein [Phycisphaerales bacterium]|nr:PHP domain-containing protein [Phycisphaerales bacterium]